MVTQDGHLFHDTIASQPALRRARRRPTTSCVDALHRARLGDLLDALPDGLDTVVGERGYRLSGGERQRLTIARLLLARPRVVILDEATAHLDSESEAAVQEALTEALVGRTAIVIAHRLSTVRAADEIAVVEDGRVVERGTHDELLAAGGRYAALYRTQFAQDGAAEWSTSSRGRTTRWRSPDLVGRDRAATRRSPTRSGRGSALRPAEPSTCRGCRWRGSWACWSGWPCSSATTPVPDTWPLFRPAAQVRRTAPSTRSSTASSSSTGSPWARCDTSPSSTRSR